MNTVAITPISQAPSARASVRPVSSVSSVRPVMDGNVSVGGVRLTRRGRLVVLLAALAFVLVLGIALGGVSTASEEAGQPRPTEVVVVDDGDTLWAIAAEVAEDGQVRSVMKDIERLNALESPSLMVGQKLLVPTGE
ncbi:LysM peptidoglycan-binding domain-containing protein [Nocardioides gilvus]|uniref:LysM peptidoglycan-binding domain-containing protein n=1 Tax=Nocardioides gilvus TaxID=1735589 RepID=UPI0019519DBC|nr:LysM peptidoglycan-binding domain-containing protein [Nocardioides gilvus]